MMTLNKLKKDALNSNIPIVKDNTLNVILDIIAKNNIRNILEIGTATAYSAINFALANKDIKVFTIEKNQNRFLDAKKNIDEFKLEKQIKVVCADANQYLSTTTFFDDYISFLEEDKFDLLFIDAAKGQYINFLKLGLKHLKKDGIIIADNVLFKGYVLGEYNEKKHRTIVNNLRKFIDIMQDKTKFETEILDIDDGLLFSHKK